MKKLLLILMLTTYTNHLIAQQTPTRLTLTQEESGILTYLHDSYMRDKLFYKNLSNADLTLSLDILSRKIKLLNKEMLPENNRDLKLLLLSFGMIPLLIAICLTVPFDRDLYALYTQFKSGKFKNINLPFYIIKDLSSKTISKKEKQYLKRFSFENQYFEYTKDPFASQWVRNPKTGWMEHISQEEVVQSTIANLSSTEQEKIKYLALRSAITNLKVDAIIDACFIVIILTIGAFYSSAFLYGAFTEHAKNQEEIELNKKLYKKLYNLLKEQERYQFI